MNEYREAEIRIRILTKQIKALKRVLAMMEADKERYVKKLGGDKHAPRWKKIALKAASKLPPSDQLNSENPSFLG